jgi:hypothetical protein
MNLLTYLYRTWISIKFSNGDSYYTDEERTHLGKKRHNGIAQCVAALRQLTFQSRAAAFFRDLRSQGELLLGTEVIDTVTIVGALADAVAAAVGDKPGPVILTRNAALRAPKVTLDLKACRNAGALELGIQRQPAKVAPDEVYACETPSMFEKGRTRALKFSVTGDYDPDVVMACLSWLAEPGNVLE